MYPIEKANVRIEHLEAQIEAMREEIRAMKDFVSFSPKFRVDTTIQVGDVADMLGNILSNNIDVEFEPWGASCWIDREKEYRANWLKNFA